LVIYKLCVPGPIEDVEEVRVLEWHGAAGQAFAPGEMIVELETHKALVEVRAGQPGTLRAVLCEAGDWKALGEALAILSDAPDEPLPDDPETLSDWPVDFEVN
jgi:pyruvate/2-oxoglutarate dehydrogenase complex dihydrolipoamide acyltransferase (E2) component